MPDGPFLTAEQQRAADNAEQRLQAAEEEARKSSPGRFPSLETSNNPAVIVLEALKKIGVDIS